MSRFKEDVYLDEIVSFLLSQENSDKIHIREDIDILNTFIDKIKIKTKDEYLFDIDYINCENILLTTKFEIKETKEMDAKVLLDDTFEIKEKNYI